MILPCLKKTVQNNLKVSKTLYNLNKFFFNIKVMTLKTYISIVWLFYVLKNVIEYDKGIFTNYEHKHIWLVLSYPETP